MEHKVIVLRFADTALRTDTVVVLVCRVQINQVAVALCGIIRDRHIEGVNDRIVLRLLVVTVFTGPDQSAVIGIPLEICAVGIALRRSLGKRELAVEAEVELCAGCTGVIGNRQVHRDLVAGLDIVGIGRTGGVACSVRNHVVNDRSARSLFACGIRSAVAHDQLDAVELVRNIIHFRDTSLRTHADALRVVLVQINSIGRTVTCIRRNGHSEGIDHSVLLRLLFMTVLAGPDQCIVFRIPLEVRRVRITLCCSPCQRQSAVKLEIELRTCGTGVVLNREVERDLVSGIHLNGFGITLSIRNEAIYYCTLCRTRTCGRLCRNCIRRSGCRRERGKHSGSSKAEGRQCRNESLHFIPFPDNVRRGGCPPRTLSLCVLRVELRFILRYNYRLLRDQPSRSAVRDTP